MRTLDVDLTDLALYRDGFPHELFAGLRTQGTVLHHPRVPLQAKPEGIEFWALLGHAEVQQANRDWETFSALSGPSIGGAPPERSGHELVSADPPIHTRLRKLISEGFTRRTIVRLDEQIGNWTSRILDAAAERGDCDFVRDIAYLLPMHVIADIIGIPVPDRAWVFERFDTFMRAPDPQSGISLEERELAQIELFRYAQELGEDKRRHPAEDVWSVLTFAEVDLGQGVPAKLTVSELDLFFTILSIAGSETTRNAISQGFMALANRPDQLEAWRADPALFETAVDEILRWASPVMSFGRTATRDVELGGEQIRAGDRITMWYPSANRDERAFDNPFRFDVTRSPNPHVSFGGGGVHYCLGAQLAKRQIRTVFEQLLARFHVDITGAPQWTVTGPDHSVGVSVNRLPVRVTAR